ncbi:helix-hairpin-helix domain-containing protein [Arthrobacter sp. TWP1-1]|uniref:helix-hairpin-helix domain-containing protein n=1 Tax=Arthrobacter sp. TWP1-1 TaxID=2804568 RepID=UPI003CF1CEEB
MSGDGGEWTPRRLAEVSRRHGRLQGPRWVVSLRALVVVLAMIAAALGVLWVEAAGVQGASAQLSSDGAGKVAVPPVGEVLPSVAVAATEAASVPASPGSSLPGDSSPGSSVVVHVVGAVKNPGVFTLAQGSRVFQAIDAAGGALPDAGLSALNLAAPLSDGGQILVPTKEEAASMAVPGVGTGPESGAVPGAQGEGLVNLNTATAADFEALPGVGPVLAERIVAWRTDHGSFSSVEGLNAVTGIGPKLLAGLRDLVTVS